MQNEIFVRNVKELCKINKISVLTAEVESGAGKGTIANAQRGREPGVGKIQALAAYFGVTTSQLLGEVYFKHTTGHVLLEGGGSSVSAATPGEDGLSIEELRLVQQFRAADEATRAAIRIFLRLD